MWGAEENEECQSERLFTQHRQVYLPCAHCAQPDERVVVGKMETGKLTEAAFPLGSAVGILQLLLYRPYYRALFHVA